MNAIQKFHTLPIGLRYVLSVPIAFSTSIMVLGCYGFPEKGADLLSAERVSIFATVFLAGFCFPALSRWFHSAALLGFGVALYCVLNPIEEMSLHWDFLPQFRVVIGGGSLAVALHVVIDFVQWMIRGPTKAEWIEPSVEASGHPPSPVRGDAE